MNAHQLRAMMKSPLIALFLTLTVQQAFAHHSFAMFDETRQVTLTGDVKEFQWTNPHVWIVIKVAGANGSADQWDIESASIIVLKSKGWTKNTLKVGDKVTATILPKKDKSHGGALVRINLPNGKSLFGGLGSGKVPGTGTELPK